MSTKIKFELFKEDWDYLHLLELILSLDINAKIVNYEDRDQFDNASTIIVCNRGPEIENALSANNYEYTYC